MQLKIIYSQKVPAIVNLSQLTGIDYEEYCRIMEEFVREDHTLGPVSEAILTVIWIFFVSSGLISNSILIAVVLLSKSLRTPNTLLLLNLFIADVTNTIFSMPFTLVALIYRSWPLGTLLCKLVPFVQCNTAFVTAGTVTAIAIDRQLRILGSSTGISRKTFHRPACGCRMSCIIWCISLALSSPVLYFQRLETVLKVNNHALELCHEVWPNPTLRMIYDCLVYGFFIVVPTLTLGFSYQRIHSYLKANGLDKRRQTYLLSSSGMNESQVSTMLKKFDFLQKEINCNTKVTVILLMGIMVYVLTWLPLCLYNIYFDLFSSSISISASQITLSTIIIHVIAITSATSNAFIYGYLNTNIQKELTSRFSHLFPTSCSSPSSSL